jgi:hypothetical protein
VRQLQRSIEDIRINVQSKRKSAALDDLKKAKTIIGNKGTKITSSCRDAKICTELLTSMVDDMGVLEKTLKASADSLNGSDQEREALDKSYDKQDVIQKIISSLEEQMIPPGEFWSVANGSDDDDDHDDDGDTLSSMPCHALGNRSCTKIVEGHFL